MVLKLSLEDIIQILVVLGYYLEMIHILEMSVQMVKDSNYTIQDTHVLTNLEEGIILARKLQSILIPIIIMLNG